jgi:2-dehydro-3-deoxygalactonokinase
MIILGDWGTTRLRLFLMDGPALVARADGPGIGGLTSTPADSLRAAMQPLLEKSPVSEVILCGMAGSRHGLREVAYADCPSDCTNWAKSALTFTLDGLSVTIAAGLACDDLQETPDVMRGEETQIFGALDCHPELRAGDHMLVLPGTHSKWVHVRNGVIQAFRTWMTGELFALLRDHSTLAHVGAGEITDVKYQAGFSHGLARTSTGDLGGALFEARSAQLRRAKTPGWGVGYISGLLIGKEIADAQTRLGATAEVSLIGDPVLTALYQQGLGQAGISSRQMEGDQLAIAGLRVLCTSMKN